MALSILVFMRCKCTVNNLFFSIFGLFLYAPLRVPLRVYQPAIASCITGGGKSGQHRATHRLTAGFLFRQERDSATENNRLASGEIRVKM